jgi:iron complex outermembrane recepter protein
LFFCIGLSNYNTMQIEKKLISFTTLLFFSSYSIAQITGTVISQKKERISSVNVVLYKSVDSIAVMGTSTDEKGFFSMAIPVNGKYFVAFSSIGYQQYNSISFIITKEIKTFDLGEQILSEEAKSLNDVLVSSRKKLIQNTPLGTTVNVQSSLMTKGSSALQVLERLPGVIIDRRNNNLSLNGQSGIAVLINGRQVRLSVNELIAMLNGMSGDNIQKIELITSPTAKYDAEGGAGLINIVLKKNENEGTSLNVASTLGYGWGEKASTALSLTHGRKKINYYTTYSYLHDHSKSSWQAIGNVDMPFAGGNFYTDFFSTTKELKNTHNLLFGFDYRPNSKNFLGVNINYMNSNSKPVVNNNAVYDFTSGNYFRLLSVSNGKNVWQNLQPSFFYEHDISAKSKFNIDISYLYFSNDNPALISTVYVDKTGNTITQSGSLFNNGNRGTSFSKINIGVVKGDYISKLSEKVTMEAGFKVNHTINTNNSKVERLENALWIPDPRSQSSLKGKESIAALYSSFNFILNSKTTLTAGLRYEYWETIFSPNNLKNKYSQFFPSILLVRKLTDNSSINFNVYRRISRPAYNDLVSNLFYNDPTSVFTGNPFLKPGITNAFKTGYIYKGNSIDLTFQNEQNPIIRYQISTNTANDILVLSPQNLDYQNSINLNSNFPFTVFKWWKINVGGTSSYRKYKVLHTPKTAEKDYLFHNYYLNQNISLPKNYELEFTSWYNSRFFDGPNRIKGFGMLNFGIAKKLKNEKGKFQLAVTDVFKTMNIYTQTAHVTPVVFIKQTNIHYKDESSYNRIFKLTYSRTFGSKTNKRIKTFVADEEKARVRQ